MLKEKTNRAFLAVGAAVLVFGLLAAYQFDLAIDLALYTPTFLPAVLMESFGWLPQYLPAVLLLALFALDSGLSRALRIGCGVLAFLGSAGLVYVGKYHLTKRSMPQAAALIWSAVFTAVCVLLCWRMFSACTGAQRQKLRFVLFWGTAYLFAGLLVINILKALWQRTRFDDMLNAAGGVPENAFALFTSWTQLFGNGGSSFPSGHTAAACSVFTFAVACDLFPGWAKRRTLVWCLCWAYVAFMALCRLIIGRHFLSDTLMASAVMLLLYLALTKTSKYRDTVRKLNAA